eukprot:8300299-Ditylum_brightwellii.AAC.1
MVDLSIPGYILAALTRFKHKWPSRGEYAPHEYEIPRYMRGPQMAPIVEDLPQIPPEWKPGFNRCWEHFCFMQEL